MQITKFIVILALLGLAAVGDNSVAAVQIRDFNGADEDEIMDKVFSKYSVEGKDHNGVKNGQRILMKSTAPKAAGVILEATHKLKGAQVPGYMKANFEKAWNRFDINADGFIRAEETHTFMRSLMGKLNKFALAPGSLSDIGGGATTSAPSVKASSLTEEVAEVPKKVVAKKVEAAPAKGELSAEDEAAAEVANVEI
jgi:hypothetical protein